MTKFIEKWYDEVYQRQGFTHQEQLDNNSASPNLVELVDNILGESSDVAETACHRRRPEFYSSQIVQQRLNLNSLKLGQDRTLTRRMGRAGLDFPLPITWRLTKLALNSARQDLQQTSKNHEEVRQAELDEKISIASQTGHKTKAKILRAIRKSENNQRTFKILKAMTRRTQAMQSIERIESPLAGPRGSTRATPCTT